jgi:hypothetical protein
VTEFEKLMASVKEKQQIKNLETTKKEETP